MGKLLIEAWGQQQIRWHHSMAQWSCWSRHNEVCSSLDLNSSATTGVTKFSKQPVDSLSHDQPWNQRKTTGRAPRNSQPGEPVHPANSLAFAHAILASRLASGESCTKQFYRGETWEKPVKPTAFGDGRIACKLGYLMQQTSLVESPGMRQDLGSDFFEPSSCRKDLRWTTRHEINRTWILFCCSREIGPKIKSNAQ
jgi:hypothetical protein